MRELEKAKQYYHHGEVQKAIDIIVALLQSNAVATSSIYYPDIICYLGDCRLALYESSKNKSLVWEALTDFATAENLYMANFGVASNDLSVRLKRCFELLYYRETSESEKRIFYAFVTFSKKVAHSGHSHLILC